jgi:hypothetical protein
MKRISIVGLFLAAVFALSAMAASSASATGLLLARVAGGGSIAGVTFLSLGLLARLTTHGGKEVHCEHVHDHGLFLTPTLGDLLILFLHCVAVSNGSTFECNSEGAPTLQIHLPLLTTLFHLGLAHLILSGGAVDRVPAVVILLHKDVKISCAGGLATILVLGAVIGELQNSKEEPAPLNKPLSDLVLNYRQDANGLQHLRLILIEDALTPYDLHSITTELGKEGPVELSAQNSLTLLHLFRLSNGKHIEIELFENP